MAVTANIPDLSNLMVTEFSNNNNLSDTQYPLDDVSISDGGPAYDSNWFFSSLPYRIGIIYIADTIAPLAFSVFGMVTNIINILVFHRQGILADSCTPSLVGLAVADFFNCLIIFTNAILRCEYYVFYMGTGLTAPPHIKNPFTMAFLIGKGARLCTNFACWLTLYIALERMISVAFPFHVKRIFSARRSCFAVVTIFILSSVQRIPQLIVNKLVFIPFNNDSVLYQAALSGIDMGAYRRAMYVNEVYLRFIIAFLLVTFNTIIVVKVQHSTRIRNAKTTKNTTSTGTSKAVSQKDEKDEKSGSSTNNNQPKKEDKLTRMMVFICVFFVSCMLPGMVAISFLFLRSYAGINFPRWLTDGAMSIMVAFETINSSCNILIYYNMSSRFKKEFHQLYSSCNR